MHVNHEIVTEFGNVTFRLVDSLVNKILNCSGLSIEKTELGSSRSVKAVADLIQLHISTSFLININLEYQCRDCMVDVRVMTTYLAIF